MAQDILPVFPCVPGNFAGWVDFNGHDLADLAALNDHNACADAAVLPAARLASLDVVDDERIANVRPRDDMRTRD
jgi:hypothetical protein